MSRLAALPSVIRTTLRGAADSDITYAIAMFVVLATIWEVAATQAVNPLIPTFSETVAATVSLLGDETLWSALAASNQAMVIGYVLSVAVGVPVGLAIGRYPALERMTTLYVNLLIVTPMAMLVPLLIMATGIGLTSRVILVFLFASVMVVVNSRAGVRQADPALIDMARSFGASELRVWRRVLLPGAVPAVMAGVRIGLARAVAGMVIVELLMVSVGFGGLILEYRGFFQGDLLYAVVVIVVLEGLLLITAVRWLERRLTGWMPQAGVRTRISTGASRR